MIYLTSPESIHCMNKIQKLLLSLGATPDSMGFHYAAQAVLLSLNRTGQLYVTKMIYPEVASHYHTTWMAVERGIRRLIAGIWEKNAENFRLLTGCPIHNRPSPSQFIAVLSVYISITEEETNSPF